MAELAELRAGQRWRMLGWNAQDDAQVIILQIDAGPRGPIVHVAVEGLKLASPGFLEGISTIGHMPFDGHAAAASLSELIAEAEAPTGYEVGYEEWRQAFERGEAGIYTIGVAEALHTMEQALRQAPPPTRSMKSNKG